MEAQMLLCDYAEEMNGKLYVMGGGWNRLVAETPASVALAILVGIPWNATNQPHALRLALVDEDGKPVVPKGAEDPLVVEAKVEVGRPPGTKPGSIFNAPLAIRFPVMFLTAGGYRFDLAIDGTLLVSAPFSVVPNG